MSKFQVTSTQASFVKWTYIIEAESEDAAIEKYYAGEHADPIMTEIEDSVDGYDSVETVQPAPGDTIAPARSIPGGSSPATA